MPALNFKQQFAPAVEAGIKRTTIRAKRKDGRDPKRGDTLYLYTGQRTRACRKLRTVECLRVHEILIDRDFNVWQDLSIMSTAEKLALIKADGFAGPAEFYDFFDSVHGLPFEGILIRW